MGVIRTGLKWLLVVYLASAVKSLPMAYFLRFYYQVVTNLIIPARQYRKNGRQNTFGFSTRNGATRLFDYVTFSTYTSPLEIDMYMHKSNSTYFTDLDIARTKLVLRVFQSIFMDYYDNTKGEFKKAKAVGNFPYAPVATVQCSFKRELKPFEGYHVKSRVFAWDRKWLFVMSKFVVTKGGTERLYAVAMTKYVFKKNGRITVSPEEMIRESGLWSKEVDIENSKNYELVKDIVTTEQLEEVCSRI